MGPSAPHPKYLVVNADEMEPGTFKDRLLMEGNPHQLIEGVILARLRDRGRRRLHLPALGVHAGGQADRARDRGSLRGAAISGQNIFGSDYRLEMYLHVSAGRYICGEETALLNALEGKRAQPALEAAVSRSLAASGASRRWSITWKRSATCPTWSAKASSGSRGEPHR